MYLRERFDIAKEKIDAIKIKIEEFKQAFAAREKKIENKAQEILNRKDKLSEIKNLPEDSWFKELKILAKEDKTFPKKAFLCVFLNRFLKRPRDVQNIESEDLTQWYKGLKISIQEFKKHV